MAKLCKCQAWGTKKKTSEYEQFISFMSVPLITLDRLVTWKTMVSSGVWLQLRYTTYIDDGDSKAYSPVVAADPDPE